MQTSGMFGTEASRCCWCFCLSASSCLLRRDAPCRRRVRIRRRTRRFSGCVSSDHAAILGCRVLRKRTTELESRRLWSQLAVNCSDGSSAARRECLRWSRQFQFRIHDSSEKPASGTPCCLHRPLVATCWFLSEGASTRSTQSSLRHRQSAENNESESCCECQSGSGTSISRCFLSNSAIVRSPQRPLESWCASPTVRQTLQVSAATNTAIEREIWDFLRRKARKMLNWLHSMESENWVTCPNENRVLFWIF